MTDKEAVEFIATTLSGLYYHEKRNAPNRKRPNCYQASDAGAESVLRQVVPYLRVKKSVAASRFGQ
jgi:hypothetical protein